MHPFTPDSHSLPQITVGVGMGVTTVTAGVVAANNDAVSSVVSEQLSAIGNRVADNVPIIAAYPRLVTAATTAIAAGGLVYYMRCGG